MKDSVKNALIVCFAIISIVWTVWLYHLDERLSVWVVTIGAIALLYSLNRFWESIWNTLGIIANWRRRSRYRTDYELMKIQNESLRVPYFTNGGCLHLFVHAPKVNERHRRLFLNGHNNSFLDKHKRILTPIPKKRGGSQNWKEALDAYSDNEPIISQIVNAYVSWEGKQGISIFIKDNVFPRYVRLVDIDEYPLYELSYEEVKHDQTKDFLNKLTRSE